MLRLVCHTQSWHPLFNPVLHPGTIPTMTDPKVNLDPELAAAAEAKAAASGERLEDVLERMVRAYLEDGGGNIHQPV